MRDHAKTVYEKNGLKGFYRALYPTVLRAGVLTAAQLGVYDQAKHTSVISHRPDKSTLTCSTV